LNITFEHEQALWNCYIPSFGGPTPSCSYPSIFKHVVNAIDVPTATESKLYTIAHSASSFKAIPQADVKKYSNECQPHVLSCPIHILAV